MNTTAAIALPPQAQQTLPADSARRAEWKARQAALRKKLQADEASAAASHSDSVYFLPTPATFSEVCVPAGDMATAVSPSAYQKSYVALAHKADSLALRTPALDLKAETAPALLEPTPRGHAPLRPYAGSSVMAFVAVVLALCVVRVVSRPFLGDLFGFFSGSIGWKRLESSQFVQKDLCFYILNGIFAVMLAVIAVEAALVFRPDTLGGIGAYHAAGALVVAIVAYFLGRLVADTVISYAFKVEGRLRAVTLHRRAARGIMGLFLAPCALAMPFVSADGCVLLVAAAAIVTITVSVLCLGKAMRINMTSLPTILYFILYLCVVEAAPLVCLARLAFLASSADFQALPNQ